MNLRKPFKPMSGRSIAWCRFFYSPFTAGKRIFLHEENVRVDKQKIASLAVKVTKK